MGADFSDSNPELGQLYGAHIQSLCRRHDRALERSGASHAVIFAGSPKSLFLDDQDYPFKANPHFLGWVPLPNVPRSYLVYTPGEKPVLVYNIPKDYWHPVPDAPSGYWTAFFDIRIVHDPDAVAAHLPTERDRCILIGEIDQPSDAFGIERVNPSTALHVLHFARSRKTEYELACLRAASRRAARGHVAAESAFRSGAAEFDIHRAYCQAVDHVDNELPYGNIVALNEHGAVLHYTNLDREPPAPVRSFLIDAGAQVHGYAADITRTYALDDRRFSELIERVDIAQREIVGAVRSGVDYAELHLQAHRILGQVLIDAGLARGDPDALIETRVTSAFFPHGLGHLLGIQVHDVGGFMADDTGATIERPQGHPFLRLTRNLEADMVLTIEPGLYAIDMLLDELKGSPGEAFVDWAVVDWLRPFGGVRIEDNVRVTATGCENLTRDAFAAIA
jgi:Xaa-Pro dipeptidase